jgi:hypothetical protein
MASSSFILPWGYTDETVEYLESSLITAGVATRKKLDKIYKSCNRTLSPDHLISEYQYYEYRVTLIQMCEDHDWNTYIEDPVDHGVYYVHFVFDPWSTIEPMVQYAYGSIYEYVVYMENAIVSLEYGTLDDLRSEFRDDIREYSRFLESFAKENDQTVMRTLKYEFWFHPMRRYNQIQFVDYYEKIQFLEYHIWLRNNKIPKKTKKYDDDPVNYITMLQSTLYRML